MPRKRGGQESVEQDCSHRIACRGPGGCGSSMSQTQSCESDSRSGTPQIMDTDLMLQTDCAARLDMGDAELPLTIRKGGFPKNMSGLAGLRKVIWVRPRMINCHEFYIRSSPSPILNFRAERVGKRRRFLCHYKNSGSGAFFCASSRFLGRCRHDGPDHRFSCDAGSQQE